MSLKNTLFQRYKNVAEYFVPVLKKSDFLDKGVLTPDEFVAAGDVLTQKTPAWCWQGVADASKRFAYLPKEKQFLMIRNVICRKRIATLKAETTEEEVEGEDGWVGTHIDRPAGGDAEVVDMGEDPTVAPTTTATSTAAASSAAPPPPQEEEEVPDLDDFVDVDNIVKDIAAVSIEPKPAAVLATRTYDITITYDKYYQTPRVWLFGHNEAGKPLTKDEMFEDIDSDFSNKTVTMEAHPFFAFPHVAIHPCRHAEQMVRMTERLNAKVCDALAQRAESEGTPFDPAQAPTMRPDLYLIVFLKMIQVIIPTIEYDIAYIDI